MSNLENDLMTSLEDLNIKYINLLNSKEVRIGKNLLSIKESIINMKLSNILTLIRKKYNQKKINKKFNFVAPEQNLASSQRIKNIKHEKIDGKVAIYTCITGGYDEISEPIFKNNEYDFFIFSEKKIKSKIRRYKSIPNEIKALNNNTLINRYIKMHPFDFFHDYDYAVYIDGNVCIASDISPLIKVSKHGETGFAMHKHVLRDCIYDEAEICKMYGKGDSIKLDDEIKRYKQDGFPKNYGMLEATIIIFDLKSKICKKIMDNWWKEFIFSESYRDQIALPYILWKNGYSMSDVGNLGNNLYRNPKFHIQSH